MTWYHRKYSGSKAAHMWQASAGLSIVLLLVVLPASIDFIMKREGKKFVGKTLSTGEIVDRKYTGIVDPKNRPS